MALHLQTIWNDLPETIPKSVVTFRKRLMTCIKPEVGHFEHSIIETYFVRIIYY